MPLNLDPIKQFIEGEMIDTILVERPGEGYRDGEFNYFSGDLIEASTTTIWNGNGIIMSITADPSDEPEGGGEASYTRYDMMLPLVCPVLEVNDIVTIVNCVRDPANNGQKFYVESVDSSSLAVTRKALISRRDFAGNI